MSDRNPASRRLRYPLLAVLASLLAAPLAVAAPEGGEPKVPPIQLKPALSSATARHGDRVTLTIAVKPEPGYHAYPVTQRTPDYTEPTTIAVDKRMPWAQVLWATFQEPAPLAEKQRDGSWLWVYPHEFTWSVEVFIGKDAPEGKQVLKFRVKGKVCNDSICTPLNEILQTDLEIHGEVTGQPDSATQLLLQAKEPIVRVVPIDAGDMIQKTEQAQGLFGFLLLSTGAAVLMLLTPCVFPMIPITVSFFLKQSEKKNHNPLPSAIIYSLTIVLVLSAAVFFLGQLIITLANNAWLNLGLGAVLIFFALSLFGMYEIELPSSLAQFTSARQGGGGYLGTVFMALTFTITSFTCTGPFLGPLLVGVKESGIGTDKLILGAVAYSATFASPFFVLALFPTLLKRLPKSGGWLNAVKVVMGFLELAAAFKFLGNTDLALNPGSPAIFNYETVLCAWIALSVGCALYLFGVFRLPHDTPVENVGVVRMLLAAGFLALALYMAPALWREKPQGVVGRGLVAFLPLDTKPNAKELTWERDFETAWKQAADEGKPLFIDFTGVNCTNCRYNENDVFVRPEVHKELEKYVRVQLYTDSVPDPGLSRNQASEQAERNKEWLHRTFNDLSNPYYAIIRPQKGQPALLTDEEGNTKLNGASLAWTRKGLIEDVKDFRTFLERGQSMQVGQALAAR